MPKQPVSRLRIRHRRSFLAAWLAPLRWLILAGLLLALGRGAWIWLANSQAFALEFTPHNITTASTAKGVQDFLTYDFDGDKKQDFATAGLDGINVYENDGKFKFVRHTLESQPGAYVRLADIDHDGKQDIVAVFRDTTPKIRWYEKGENFDFSPHDVGGVDDSMVMTVGDLTGDKYPEIVTAGKTADGNIALRLWMNSGGTLDAGTVLLANSGVTSLAIADLDHNGINDIITGGAGGLQQWRTADLITWSRMDVDDQRTQQTFLSAGDPKVAGTWILALSKKAQRVDLYRSGSGDFTNRYGYKAIDTGSIDATGAALADLNGDGHLDILVTGQDNNNVYWFENDGQDNFSKHTLATGLQSVAGVAAANFGGNSDVDVVSGDMMRGIIYVYERIASLPIAETPLDIKQSTDGSGQVLFTVKLLDPDRRSTQLKIEYTDGSKWYKPWLLSVKPDVGTVDWKNSNDFQVGTSNAIDTDVNENVTLTVLWDTKSSLNGSPILGDNDKVKLRVTPKDSRMTGKIAITSSFRVDNKAPQNVKSLALTETVDDKAALTWAKVQDSNEANLEIAYGTNNDKVLNKKSNLWGSSKDSEMGKIGTVATTVSGMTIGETYFFKLFATDALGNVASSNVISAVVGSAEVLPEPAASPEATSSPESSIAPSAEPLPEATDLLPLIPASPQTSASTLTDNRAPVSNGGENQLVNPGAMVILEAGNSYDPDSADNADLQYVWRQMSGPAVKLLGERSARASFVAGASSQTYIFSLTVKDGKGASATDLITVATRGGQPIPLPLARVAQPSKLPSAEVRISTDDNSAGGSFWASLLRPVDIALFALSVLSSLLMLAEKYGRRLARPAAPLASAPGVPQGRLVHYRTGAPITNAQVLIYDAAGKLRATQRVNSKGSFPTYFPPGQYTLTVQAPGFVLTEAGRAVAPENGILYTGGKINVRTQNEPLNLVIAMKPTGSEVSSVKTLILQSWQMTQHYGRLASWPLFVAGALINTGLVFIAPDIWFITLEVLYVVLIVAKIFLEMQIRPAYGLVRDAITRVPVDLAVVRLFEQGTNRLIMTRVTSNQGKFFALPPAGRYVITITKPGYASFSKDNVDITAEQGATLQLMADLLPVVPQHVGAIAAARAAV